MSNKINQEDLTKALSALEDLSKGHNSRGTAATQVETMSAEGGATQVFHTPSDSNPQSWAGTTEKESPENGATDAIDENGTDYKGGAEMVKSVLEMVQKGEISAAAGAKILSKAFEFGKDDEDEEKAKKGVDKDCDDDEKVEKSKEEDKEISKSLADHAQDNSVVREGLEVSSFLSGWSETVSKSLDSVEGRLQKSIAQGSARQEGFNEGLAKAMSDLGNAVAAVVQRVEQVESQPAGAPKSVMSGQVQVVEKSLAGSEPSEALNKSQINVAMESLVKSGDLDPFEVLRFDSSGELKPEIRDAVANYYNTPQS